MSTAHKQHAGAPKRVLVTGSTTWANPAIVRDALRKVWGEGNTVLVTAERPCGAERIAEMFWRRWGGQVERHPSDWALHSGKGADVCLAFVRDGAPGTAQTVHLAESAGIPVYMHTNHTRTAADGPSKRDRADAPAPTGRTAEQEQRGTAPVARVWLDVPFREKNQAKKLGAAWDREARRWHAPDGMTEGLARWAPAATPAAEQTDQTAPESPVAGNGSAQAQPASTAPDSDTDSDTTSAATGVDGAAAAELGATVVAARELMSPHDVVRHYSYPEIAALLANAPHGQAAQVCRDAMRLVIDQPELFAGDQAGEIARQLSAAEIARHRDAIGHGPLFELLGEAADQHAAGQDENGAGRDVGESVARANHAVAELAGAVESARQNGDASDTRRPRTDLWSGPGEQDTGRDREQGDTDGDAR